MRRRLTARRTLLICIFSGSGTPPTKKGPITGPFPFTVSTQCAPEETLTPNLLIRRRRFLGQDPCNSAGCRAWFTHWCTHPDPPLHRATTRCLQWDLDSHLLTFLQCSSLSPRVFPRKLTLRRCARWHRMRLVLSHAFTQGSARTGPPSHDRQHRIGAPVRVRSDGRPAPYLEVELHPPPPSCDVGRKGLIRRRDLR